MPIDNAVPSKIHGVIENTSGIQGVAVLYSVGQTHFRARLRPVTPLDGDPFDHGDAWTMFEWSEVEDPEEDAEAVEWFDVTHVPHVVRDEIPAPVQVPDLGATDEDVRNAVEDAGL
jgi:hypothetical protein